MILRHDESGWTAELPDPAGLMVRGGTREEARERGFALMEKMSGLPTNQNRIETASRQI